LLNKFIIIVLSISLVFLSTPSFALTKGFEAISLRPATDGGPYIGIWGSKNLGQFEWEAGTLAVYAYRPLQLTQNGNRARGILDNTLVQHFYSQLGIVDRWLSIGFDLPMGWWADFRNPNVATTTNQNKVVVGDAYINLKSEFVRTKHFGLALRPFITIPTGYGREFFGNGVVSGGGTLIAEIIPHDYASFSFNIGIDAREKFVFRNIEKSRQLNLGFGTAIKLTDPLSLVAEVEATTRLSDPFEEKVESPAEFRGGIKWAIGKSGLLATAGGSAGIMRGSGAPTYSVFAGLSFSPRRRTRKVKKSKIDFAEYTVHFASGSATIDNSEDAQKLCDLSDKIRKTNMPIKVQGYTDATGSETFNRQLSEKRADKVAWWLTLLGIDPLQILTEGFGEADPVGSNATMEGRAANRRVEFETAE